MSDKFFITTPIYYVNDKPHIGHTYTTLAADVLARYYRLKGKKVFFLTGTDEHGQKVYEASLEKKKDPEKFCDEVSACYVQSWEKYNFSFDFFIRTTDKRHIKFAQGIISRIYKNGYIYKGKYQGLYCLGCEKFVMKDDLVNGNCPYHPNRKPIKKEENNYFFKLSSFREKLIEIIEDKNHRDHYEILPDQRKNEILGKIKKGLEDISISREGFSWGIPLPWDKNHTIYVWVEALFNYYTVTQFLPDKKGFWPPDIHLMAKDILWFHAVIWEALLLAAKLPLPKTVYAHGFFTINGQKMSKSLKNIIPAEKLVEIYGADASRYLLLSAFPFGQDGDISFEKLTTNYNADLANNLGNLVSRTGKLCQLKKFIRQKSAKPKKPIEVFQKTGLVELIENLRLDAALLKILEKVKETNHYIDQEKIWDLKGKDAENVLLIAIDKIIDIGYCLLPFLPETGKTIIKEFSKKDINFFLPLFKRIR